jgi:hypothetical protein
MNALAAEAEGRWTEGGLYLLSLRGVIDAALEDAAAVTVGRHLNAVTGNGIVDELVVLSAQMVQAALHNVVSVEILDERDDSGLEPTGDETNLQPGTVLCEQTARMRQGL